MFMQCQAKAVAAREIQDERRIEANLVHAAHMRRIDAVMIGLAVSGTSICLGVIFARAVLGMGIPNPFL